jgi:DNA-binding transcriptional LysR family regulator
LTAGWSLVKHILLAIAISKTHDGGVLNLRQLEFFVAAADAGTMTGAAAKLYVSQSAVSLAIAQLERSLGTQLLIRQKARGLELTPAGRRLLPEARALLAHADEVRAAGEEEGGGLRGALTVGCFRTAAPFLLPELLETFAAEQPEVALDFIEGPSNELAEALLAGLCEIALLYDQDLPPGIATEPVRTLVPYALMAPRHPLAKRRSVGLDELAPYPMIMLDVAWPAGIRLTRRARAFAELCRRVVPAAG